MTQSLSGLVVEVERCRICAASLPFGPRPVIQVHQDARILIAGQAPGRRVHDSGIPFDDPSGDRLREWMGVSRTTFYDPKQIAILPIGFCYPGTGKSGDLAPRRECAPAWRSRLIEHLKNIELTLVVGQYAQKWHLPNPRKNLTETVRAFRDYGPDVIPLPHPSPRNNIWLKKNAWFADELLPELSSTVARLLHNAPDT